MASLTDRKSDRYRIAKRSQTIAVSATASVTEVRMFGLVETSPSIVTYLTREAGSARSGESQRLDSADAMDGATRFDLSTIEAIELDAEVKCAGPGCQRPADYLIGRWCSHCGWVAPVHREDRTQPCCDPHWREAKASKKTAICRCGALVNKSTTFHIVEVLR